MDQPRIVWLASYPKSGNTWARFIIANMFFGEVKTSADIEQMVPDVHRGKEIKAHYHVGGTIFLKTHWALAEQMPQRDATAAAIHIVRHPLDVLRSHIDYMGFGADAEKRSAFVDAFIASAGAPAWEKRRYGNWISNLHAWGSALGTFPLLQLKYEDMKAAPHMAVRRITGFFQHQVDDDEVDRIVEAASFKRMRELEAAELESGKNGFFQTERSHSRDPNFRFMRAGTVGGYRDFMSTAQLEAARDRFGAVAAEFEYEI